MTYKRTLFFFIAVVLFVWLLYGYKCYYDYQYDKNQYRITKEMVPEKYRLYDSADDAWLLFDPSGLTESDFDACYSKACYYDSLQQRDSSFYYYRKVLSHRNSYNEQEYEKIFSCGNDYWEYKYGKWMKYSAASEKTGNKELSRVLNIEVKDFKNS